MTNSIVQRAGYHKRLCNEVGTFVYNYSRDILQTNGCSIYEDRTFYITRQLHVDNLAGSHLINCQFVVDPQVSLRISRTPIEFNCLSLSGCRFIFVSVSNYKLIRINTTYDFFTFAYSNDKLINSYIGDPDSNTGMSFPRRLSYNSLNNICFDEAVKKLVDIQYPSQEKKRLIKYANKEYNFAGDSVVCGVEFEIPVSYREVKTLDKRLWIKEHDGSQIEGNLEVVSRPLTLSYILSQKFQVQVCKLWKAVKAPTKLSSYVTEETDSGSGIHVHFSWNPELINVCAYDVISLVYKKICKLGGSVWLKNHGGKGYINMSSYSRFKKPEREEGSRYRFVTKVDDNHLEFRFCANDPDPEVAVRRVRLMSQLFYESFVECHNVQALLPFTSAFALRCATIRQQPDLLL